MNPNVVAIHRDANGNVLTEITGTISVRTEPWVDPYGDIHVRVVTECKYDEPVTVQHGESIAVFTMLDVKSQWTGLREREER